MQRNPTGYSFNNMEDIKSHSSVLFNERLAILFYLLDRHKIELYKDYTNTNTMREVFALSRQIYDNVRTLIRNDPVLRRTLGLEFDTDNGIYTTDVMFHNIEQKILYCDMNGYTMKKCFIIMQELRDVEVAMRDALQYYQYFIRANFKQKPDILDATERYNKEMDPETLEQLKSVLGKNAKLDIESLEKSNSDRLEELEAEMERASDGIEEFEDNEDDNEEMEEDEVEEGGMNG